MPEWVGLLYRLNSVITSICLLAVVQLRLVCGDFAMSPLATMYQLLSTPAVSFYYSGQLLYTSVRIARLGYSDGALCTHKILVSKPWIEINSYIPMWTSPLLGDSHPLWPGRREWAPSPNGPRHIGLWAWWSGCFPALYSVPSWGTAAYQAVAW